MGLAPPGGERARGHGCLLEQEGKRGHGLFLEGETWTWLPPVAGEEK